MRRPIVAITGASSFTGVWIARSFPRTEWEVHALIARPASEYSGLRARRVRLLMRDAERVHSGYKAEDGGLARWIAEARPDVWIHHHHFMESFRSPQYDVSRADAVGLAPLDGIVERLRESGCRGVIYSGTYFEPGEGGQGPDAASTPYAQSKRRVWLEWERLARSSGLKLSKLVIPNPIGPLENEDRLIPVMLDKARKAEKLPLHSPRSVGDNLPVFEMAEEYVRLARELLAGRERVARPSGRATTVAEFAESVNQELIAKRLGLRPLQLELGTAAGSSLRNTETLEVDWGRFWDRYAQGLREAPSL